LPLFRQVLDRMGARRVEIGGAWDSRERRARREIEAGLRRARRR